MSGRGGSGRQSASNAYMKAQITYSQIALEKARQTDGVSVSFRGDKPNRSRGDIRISMHALQYGREIERSRGQ